MADDIPDDETPADEPSTARLRPAARAPAVVGDLIGGRYRIVGELGEGAMGVVYRAIDPGLDRHVAVKLVRVDEVPPGALERFHTEARATARVRHPNVVTVHASGEHHGAPYFVMELVEGRDLDSWLEDQAELPIPIPQAISLLIEIGRGVEAIHAAGVTHGDLKPSNVLLGSDGRVVVTDLGLARILEGEGPRRAEFAGTPTYMAPEVVGVETLPERLATRPDVYSLAVIAYELLTGRPPFEPDDLVQLLNMHATIPPRSPLTLRPELGEIGEEVLLAALEKDPRLRTATVTELVEGLERLRDAAANTRAGLRIAVVDDDEDFVSFVRLAVEGGLPGAQVEAYGSGEEAEEALVRDPPSVALVDLQLPGVNGLELIARLRAESPRRFPIAVVTGVGGAKDWSVLAKLGADVFLAKPLDFDELLRALRRLIQRSSLPPPPRA